MSPFFRLLTGALLQVAAETLVRAARKSPALAADAIDKAATKSPALAAELYSRQADAHQARLLGEHTRHG